MLFVKGSFSKPKHYVVQVILLMALYEYDCYKFERPSSHECARMAFFALTAETAVCNQLKTESAVVQEEADWRVTRAACGRTVRRFGGGIRLDPCLLAHFPELTIAEG